MRATWKDRRGYVAVEDVDLRGRVLRAAERAGANVALLRSPLEVLALGAESQASRLLLIGSRFAGNKHITDAIEEIRARAPLLPILVCLTLGDPLQARLSELCRAGIDDLVLFDDGAAEHGITHQLEERFVYSLPESSLPTFDGGGHVLGFTIEASCARNGYRPPLVSDIARKMALHRSSVLRHVTRRGWASAEILCEHARLLHVARWLDETDWPVEKIALLLSFSEPSALYRLVRTLTNQTPTELRESGALQVARSRWTARGARRA